MVDPVDCQGICTSTSWTTDQISAVAYGSDSSVCCAVNVTVRQRRCLNLGELVNEVEILRIEPEILDTCDCDVQDIMKSAIRYVLNDIRNILNDTTLNDFDVYLRTSKCWRVDPADNYALKSCDTTKCYQSKYNLLYYPEYWPTPGLFVEGHKTEQSEGQALCDSCEDVITTHDIPNGFLFPQTLNEDCPDECYWRIIGNEVTDETNFLGTIDNDPLIIKTNSKERMIITSNDTYDVKIGIGTGNHTPIGALDINVGTFGTTERLGRISFDNSELNGGNGSHPVIKMYKPTGSSIGCPDCMSIPWWLEAGEYDNGHRLDFKTGDASIIGLESTTFSLITIMHGGNVGIGVTNPRQKLVVAGTVCAQEMRVSMEGEPCRWPDYVFNENYELTNLNDLEKFIKQNKHLPDIPNAKEVEANGIELGAIQAKLLKKIEELTLYIIELKKEINQLKGRRKGK